jgi:ribosomal protein L25 (general stress protein Ctc)
MATVALKVKPREDVGKGGARRTRKEGLVPAVLYGEGDEVRSLSVDAKEFSLVIHTAAGENARLSSRTSSTSRCGEIFCTWISSISR